MGLGKLDHFLFGLMFPIAVFLILLLIVMAMPTGTSAAEFSSLGLTRGAVIAAAFLLIANVLNATRPANSRGACCKRGMIAPAPLYQIGVLD